MTWLKSFLILQHIVQTADMRQDLNHKLIATVESQLGVAAPADTRWRASDAARLAISVSIMEWQVLDGAFRWGRASDLHGRPRREGGALGAVADQLGHVKDKVAVKDSPSQHTQLRDGK